MKIKKKPRALKTASKLPGWQRLTLDELIHWAHAWKVQQTNPDKLFREKESATAIHFGCDRSTISRRNSALVKAGVAQRLHENERGENQWFTESTLCVTVAPEACILKLAEAATEVRKVLASDSPRANMHTARTRVNSSDDPRANMHDIATDSINPRHKSVTIVSSSLGDIEHSSGVGATLHTVGNRINSGDEPCATLHTDAETQKIERQLKDAEKKLARLRRDYGDDEAIVISTSKDVAELRSRLLSSKVTP